MSLLKSELEEFLIGKPVKEVRPLVTYQIRVIRSQERWLGFTDDYDLNRVNVETLDGVIVTVFNIG
jgi:hypothetical protein